jgi:hypothetical protein
LLKHSFQDAARKKSLYKVVGYSILIVFGISMVGMMFENGPFHIQEVNITETLPDGTPIILENTTFFLERNNNSWNEVANVLYVEQPIRYTTEMSHLHTNISFTQISLLILSQFLL